MQKRMYMGKELYNPFGTLESETVLWTNPNPTDSNGFAAQTVTLSDSINNYDEIAVEYGYNNSASLQTGVYVYRDIWSVDIFKRNTYNTSDTRNVASFGVINSANGHYIRAVNYVTNTTVRISACYALGGTATINQDAIPLKIIGIKKGWQPVYSGYNSVLVPSSALTQDVWYSIPCIFKPKFVVYYMTPINDGRLYTFTYDVDNLDLKYSRNNEFEVSITNNAIKVEGNNVVYKPTSSGFVADTRFVICG